ncbi:hypothetical protein EDC51_104201 [Bibersteinia trehalosi]|nr:hypothetical protein EDC51_104201 [Bibersteinia trehalosi]
MYIFDIFTHNNTAKFFDAFISKVCITGHEVAFLTKEFADSLCHLTGWGVPKFHDISLRWVFHHEKEMIEFLYLLLGIDESTSEQETLNAVKKYLGITYYGNKIYLNWDMTLMICDGEI